MPDDLANISFDGSPVRFRLNSSSVVCFDPLALELLGDLLPAGIPFDVGELVKLANANHPTIACCTIPDFEIGTFTLDPHDIKRFGDEEDEFDYAAGDEPDDGPVDEAHSFPFVSVDSGVLMIVDSSHVPDLISLLTWEQYDLGLQDAAVFGKVADALGGAYFAVIGGGCMPGMEFDGDGLYTLPIGSIRAYSG